MAEGHGGTLIENARALVFFVWRSAVRQFGGASGHAKWPLGPLQWDKVM
jgi:hypothetical protein